ncbi:GNAT family N-acetyltransferase [Aquabacter sp. CN5-332]|uniref:GNAT family N-acetyltransferase n=1 Tax=Aquabacter sp. CN5-332 TaxID=3156608 RepID=UPI0032B5DAFE
MDVRDNESAARYELETDQGLAVATYRMKGDVITFIHTEVPPEIRRRGIAARLIAGALEDVRARGLKFRTICPFVTTYVEHHPELRDLLAGGGT